MNRAKVAGWLRRTADRLDPPKIVPSKSNIYPAVYTYTSASATIPITTTWMYWR